MMKLACVLAIAFASVPVGLRAAAEDAKVSYVSPDHVYVDQGTTAGFASGDTLVVTRDGRAVAMLVVEFAAGHSA